MKVGAITTSNDKGQIVIPKGIREALDIHNGSTLSVTLAGNGMYICPVEDFLTKSEMDSSYLQLLEITKGAWTNES